MNVINISLGGLLGQYATIKSDTEYYNDIKVGKILNDIEIVFPYKNEDTYIKINKSEVKRINQDSKLKQTHYALQFVSIDKIERNKLVELLYEYQAQLLRERLPF
jgi:c-di-GMP-binding flagellar brake protein YcgR